MANLNLPVKGENDWDAKLNTAVSAVNAEVEVLKTVQATNEFLGSPVPTNSNLNSFGTPGTYRISDSTGITNLPVANFIGVLVVYSRDGGVRNIQLAYPHTNSGNLIDGRVFYMRTSNGGGTTWTDWRAQTSQRVDTTAGRAIYSWDYVNNQEQLIYGDTGRRDIASLFTDSWIVSSAQIRRNGPMVELNVSANRTFAGGITTFLTIPTGFRPANTINKLNGEGSLKHGIIIGSGDGLVRLDMDVNAIRWYLTWMTGDSWPTTLPGTPVGSIANL